MRLLPFRIGMGHQGARFAQPKAPLPEQALTLAHPQADLEASLDPGTQRLPIPQRAGQAEVTRGVESNIPPSEERLPAAGSLPDKSYLGPPAAPHEAGDRSVILPNGESRLAIPERLSRHLQPGVVSWLHETTVLHNAQLLMTLSLEHAYCIAMYLVWNSQTDVLGI